MNGEPKSENLQNENQKFDIFSGETYGPENLPGDLFNAVNHVYGFVQLYEAEACTEDEIRNALKDAQTFEEYVRYKARARGWDEARAIEDSVINCNPDLVAKFNEGMESLRDFADKTLDTQTMEAIKEIIEKKIVPLRGLRM